MSAQTPREILKTVFGYDSFRPLQEEIISNVLAKRDVLAVMPTGGGKSLCYEVPALLFPGLTVVVSPLIALMQDQVSQLETAGVEAVLLNSALERDDYSANIVKIRQGTVKLLYVAPESLVTARVQELLATVRVDCVTIDEAHCISEWGHDFRPEYRKIAEIRDLFPHSTCLALTATATEQVRKDIKKNLKLDNPAIFVASFNRANIFLDVVRKKNPVHQILSFLESRPGESGIVYCFSRKLVDSVAEELSSRGYAALPYHAGLADDVRSGNQERFLRDEAKIMVATVAFGMGIDKPNVRFVIHHDLPKSLEQYYQEIGRAGRDGGEAHALLLYSYADTQKIKFFMEDKSAAETKKAEAHLKAMTSYAENRTCRRRALLEWFGEPLPTRGEALPDRDGSLAEADGPADSAKVRCCDICERGPAAETDVTVPAQKFLSCVARTGERYGAAYVTDVLLGSRQKRIVDNGHNKLSTWGIGKGIEKDDWFELARVLVDSGYLLKDEEYGVLSLTPLAREVLFARDAITLPFGTAPEGMLKAGNAKSRTGAETATTGGKAASASGQTAAAAAGKLAFPKRTASALDEADIEGERILSRLKTLRRGLAEAASVPPYVIFSDKTLEDIARKKPATRTALLDVYGIGEIKAEKYGDYIMNTVKERT